MVTQVVETKEQLVRRFREVQDVVINETVKAIENAKQRRQKIQQLWSEYRGELQKTVQDRLLEEIGERSEKKFSNYLAAKNILSRKHTPSNVDSSALSKVVEEENGVKRLLESMRRDETAEGKAIKVEAELVQRELEELEKVLTIAKRSKGRLLTVEETQELLTHIHNAQTTLAREVSEDSYITNVEAAENKLAAAIGSFAHNMSQLEFKESKQAQHS